MADGFYANLGGVRFTESRINEGGPLPTEGVSAVADGRYNATTELLRNVRPYAMPKDGSLNSNKGPQTAHRVAAGIPRVELPEPEPKAEGTFSLFHAVDNGDVAFLVKPLASRKYVWLSQRPYQTQNPRHQQALVNVNIFLNVVQVNYVLAGIFNRLAWRVENPSEGFSEQSSAWDALIASFGAYTKKYSNHIVDICKKMKKNVDDHNKMASITKSDADMPVVWNVFFVMQCHFLLQHIIEYHIQPFGICAGSEKQGGQHEARDKPVQAAASYFTTLTVDGQNRDLVNLWRNSNIEGGDQLIMHLAPVARPKRLLYTLNHYSKGTVAKFVCFEDSVRTCVLQLVPTFYKAVELESKLDKSPVAQLLAGAVAGMNRLICQKVAPEERAQIAQMTNQWPSKLAALWQTTLDYRVSGYWHCGQTYTKSANFGLVLAPHSDLEYMSGALLQVNWAPVWKSDSRLEWLDAGDLRPGGGTSLKRKLGDGKFRDCISDYDLAYWISHSSTVFPQLMEGTPGSDPIDLICQNRMQKYAGEFTKQTMPAESKRARMGSLSVPSGTSNTMDERGRNVYFNETASSILTIMDQLVDVETEMDKKAIAQMFSEYIGKLMYIDSNNLQILKQIQQNIYDTDYKSTHQKEYSKSVKDNLFMVYGSEFPYKDLMRIITLECYNKTDNEIDLPVYMKIQKLVRDKWFENDDDVIIILDGLFHFVEGNGLQERMRNEDFNALKDSIKQFLSPYFNTSWKKNAITLANILYKEYDKLTFEERNVVEYVVLLWNNKNDMSLEMDSNLNTSTSVGINISGISTLPTVSAVPTALSARVGAAAAVSGALAAPAALAEAATEAAAAAAAPAKARRAKVAFLAPTPVPVVSAEELELERLFAPRG